MSDARQETLAPGTADFIAGIEFAIPASHSRLRRLADWANELEQEGFARVSTYHGKTGLTLPPRLPRDGVGLVSIYNAKGDIYAVLAQCICTPSAARPIRCRANYLAKSTGPRHLDVDDKRGVTSYAHGRLSRGNNKPRLDEPEKARLIRRRAVRFRLRGERARGAFLH
jgi:hypothetical protein